MELANRSEGPVLVVELREARLDAREAGTFKQQIADLIARGHRRIVLDLGAVEFIDSSGLGAIISGLKQLGDHGELALASLRPPVMGLVKLTRMDKVFRIFEAAPHAVTALAA